jgi:hypothetical protein
MLNAGLALQLFDIAIEALDLLA